jgi:hypothetical protein
MSPIVGWRIQVRPPFCEPDITSSIFVDVHLASPEDAIAFVRNREDAEWGESVYAIRPLYREAAEGLTARVIPLTDDVRRARRSTAKHKTG